MTPAGWISKKLWELTYWDKRFNGVDKSKQKKILPFKHVSAEKLKSICVRGGKIKLLATGKFDGYTTKDLAQDDVNCGEVLTLPSGGTAAIKYFNGTFVDSGNIIAQTSDAEQYCLKFIYYYLMCINNVIAKEYRGTSIKHPYMPAILELSIPVPSLSEQQQIVEKLDALFADIEKEKQIAQQNLQNAKELFESEKKSLMQKVQHYENVHLVDLYNFIDYRGVTPNKIDTGVPLVTAKNVKMGYIDYTIKDFISEEDYLARQSRGISKKGDILFTTEAPLGNVAIADLDKFSAGQRIITLQQYSDGKLELSNDFYCYYMQSDYFQTIIHSLASGATAQGIKAAKLKLVLVPLVPYQIQKEIVEKLDALHEQTQKLEQIYTQQIADLDELKQAILKKAFNGEL